MKVRALFSVSKVAVCTAMCYKNGIATDVLQREITMYPICRNSNDPESVSFAEATPSGTLTFTLNNADLKDEFQPGMEYYLTFERRVK